MNLKALAWAVAVGVALQVAMVISGHFSAKVSQLFAVGGMAFSLAAGLIYAGRARPGWAGAAGGGALAGGLCALVGIAVSLALGDVEPPLLALGTLSSAVTGAVGGAIGKLAAKGA